MFWYIRIFFASCPLDFITHKSHFPKTVFVQVNGRTNAHTHSIKYYGNTKEVFTAHQSRHEKKGAAVSPTHRHLQTISFQEMAVLNAQKCINSHDW